MANYTSTHTGATIDASVTIVSGSGVTQSDLTKLNAVTSSAIELNILDGVTASTAEINILDGLTATTAELNYLDGADSSITTLSLPDNTTITTFGASLIDDADAATARTTLGVDVAGTDNSTDVTLVTTSHDYLSISGQAITLGSIDISDDTNLTGGTGITLTGDTLSTTDSEIVHDNLSGFVANEHIDHSTVSISAGSGLSGGGDLTSTRTLSIDSSVVTLSGTQTLSNKSISGTANTISNVHIVDDTINTLTIARGGTGGTTSAEARSNLNVDVAGTDNSTDVTLVTTSHDYLSLSGQAVTLGQIDISDDTNLVGGTGITLTGDTLSTTDSEIVHDDLSGFVANEHIDHSGVSITAGAGLTGGGDITATRDIAVGAGTGVTVNADDIAIGQDVGTNADVTFNSVIADNFIGPLNGAVEFEAKATVALNKGDAVYVVGVSGNTPTIALADANDATKMPAFGLVASSASIDDIVEVVTFGTLTNINTSSFSEGDILFISSNGTAGNTLTATKEGGESVLCQNIGKVIRSHATVGSIKVGGAGRANATPNLNDGNIFIGNGSNEPVTAALNTKIQDYLNTGVNLPSPTFSGDIDFSDASTPQLDITDTTNNITTRISSNNSTGNIGTSTDHQLNILRNNVANITLFSGYTMHNNDGNDLDFRAKDSSGNVVFKVNAGTSTTEIGTLSVTGNSVLAGDLQVNGTTTTVNQTNLDVSDNIIGLNRGAASNANDSGLIIERGSTGDNVFIGWDESLDRIRFATTASDASSTGDLSLTNANIHAGRLYADVSGDVTGNADTATALATARNFSLTGDVTAGAVSFDGSGNVALSTTIAANSVALGTDTTGNYMSDLTEGTGIDISHTPGEGSNGTITLDLTEVGFGGGANRLITDDGDGTVSTESGFTIDGTTLLIGDSKVLGIGNGTDLELKHDTNQNYIDLNLGNLTFRDELDNNVFRIKKDGGIALLEGDAQIPATSKLYFDGGSDTYITESSADLLKIFVGNEAKLEIDEGNENIFLNTNNLTFRTPGFTAQSKFDILNNKLGIGTTSPAVDLHILDTGGHSQLRIETDNASSGAYLELESTTNKYQIYNVGGDLGIDESGVATRFIIKDSTGNVGIGTDSPSTKLEVAGGFRISETGDGTDYLEIGVGADATTGGTSVLTNNGSMVFGTTDSSSLIVRTNNTEAMRIDTSQNVGIGTTDPSSLDATGNRLVVGGGSGDEGLTIFSGTTGRGTMLFADGNDGSNAEYRGWIQYEHTNDSLEFATASAERMRIDSSGNVGIGTTSPESKLNIVDSGETIIRLYASTASTRSGIWFTNGSYSYGTNIGTDNKFHITGNINSEAELVTVDSSGNVGIGTSSPAQKLHIEGNICRLDKVGTDGGYYLYDSSNNFRFALFDNNSVTQIYADGNGSTPAMTFNGGNVGIGTTSPTNFGSGFTNLQISGSTAGSVQTTDSTNSATAELFTSGGVGYVGTRSNHSFRIKSNDTTAMTIDTSQNVGIGTASPSEKLHVYGSVDNDDVAVHIQNAFDDNSSATPPSAALTLTTASNNAYLRVFGAPADTADNHKIELGSTAGSSYITFKPSNSEAMRIDSSGNVGIGTTSPSSRLHISENGGSTDDAFEVSPDNGGNRTMTINGEKINVTTTNGGSAQSLVLNDNGGNVGIQNSSPVRNLDIGSTDANSRVRFTNTSTGTSDGSDGLEVGMEGVNAIFWNRENGYTRFATNNTERLRIEADGDVLPGADGTQDLGSLSKRWANVFFADLDLSNEGSQNDVDGTWGSYVIQEGEEDLFLINRRNGKKYKFMLQEVQD